MPQGNNQSAADFGAPTDNGAQPGADQPDDQTQDETPSAVIEVSIYASGRITIEPETGAQEGAEQGGGAEEQQPVEIKDKAEALEVISNMIDQAQGQSPEDAKQQQSAGYSQS